MRGAATVEATRTAARLVIERELATLRELRNAASSQKPMPQRKGDCVLAVAPHMAHQLWRKPYCTGLDKGKTPKVDFLSRSAW